MRNHTLVIATALVTLVLAGAVVAAPAEKATGYVEYTAGGLDRVLDFNAHEAKGDKPAKGWLRYADANGAWYDVQVMCANVMGDTAYFAGPVVSASDPTWVGLWLSAAAYDGGTPGREGDAVAGIFTSEAAAVSNCDNAVVPGDWYYVWGGNLVVHTK